LPGIPERWLQGPTGGLILGILLIVLTFVLPGGIIAGVRQIRAKFIRVVPQRPASFGDATATTIDHPVTATV